jgi:hypothetical protein
LCEKSSARLAKAATSSSTTLALASGIRWMRLLGSGQKAMIGS